jgi:hypothetical protein
MPRCRLSWVTYSHSTSTLRSLRTGGRTVSRSDSTDNPSSLEHKMLTPCPAFLEVRSYGVPTLIYRGCFKEEFGHESAGTEESAVETSIVSPFGTSGILKHAT